MMQQQTKVAIGVGVGFGLAAVIIIAVTVPVLLTQPQLQPTDTTPPSLVKCEDATFVSSTPLQPAYWTEPIFTDNVNVTGNTSTIAQGSHLPYGSYNITVKVWDAAKNEANCSYLLWVLAYDCDIKWATAKITDHTILTCAINNPYFTCLVGCTQGSGYTLVPNNADIYECKEDGKWNELAKCVRTAPKSGDPKCDDTFKAQEKEQFLNNMDMLDNTLKVRTCIPGPCYYNSSNMFQLCGDTPP